MINDEERFKAACKRADEQMARVLSESDFEEVAMTCIAHIRALAKIIAPRVTQEHYQMFVAGLTERLLEVHAQTHGYKIEVEVVVEEERLQ